MPNRRKIRAALRKACSQHLWMAVPRELEDEIVNEAARYIADEDIDASPYGALFELAVFMAHDYHGISVMRKLLSVGDQPCTITAQRFDIPVLYHCGRGGMEEPRMVTDHRKVATFAFDNGKVGFFDFAD